MSEDNPHAHPVVADLIKIDDVARGARLADPSTRLFAAIVDAIISLVYGFPLLFPAFYVMGRNQIPPSLQNVVAIILMCIGFMLFNGYFLKKNGQTLGKKLMGIRVTDLRGNVPNFGSVILLRYFPIWFVSMIPVAGMFLPIIDVLFIFRRDRRCIHDLYAGTKVLDV